MCRSVEVGNTGWRPGGKIFPSNTPHVSVVMPFEAVAQASTRSSKPSYSSARVSDFDEDGPSPASRSIGSRAAVALSGEQVPCGCRRSPSRQTASTLARIWRCSCAKQEAEPHARRARAPPLVGHVEVERREGARVDFGATPEHRSCAPPPTGPMGRPARVPRARVSRVPDVRRPDRGRASAQPSPAPTSVPIASPSRSLSLASCRSIRLASVFACVLIAATGPATQARI